MDNLKTRRTMIRWTMLGAAAAALAAYHKPYHIAPGQIRRQTTPAATGAAPGQAKKK